MLNISLSVSCFSVSHLVLERGPGDVRQLGEGAAVVQVKLGALLDVGDHVLGVFAPHLGTVEGVLHSCRHGE